MGVAAAAHPNWDYFRTVLRGPGGDGSAPSAPGGTYYVLHSTAVWGQGNNYNDLCVSNCGGNYVPTGCTATAMAILMRFHQWPITGNGSHSYNDNWGAIRYSHSANFGATTYNWANMPFASLTAANSDVANLMYHCGVVVNMNYTSGGSYAWPSAGEMNDHFRYKGTIEVTSSHDAPMIASIKAGLPVILSSSAHTVLATGYRDTMSPYYYFNAGWNGGSSGWYNLDQVPGGDPSIDRSYPYASPNNYIYVDAAWGGSESGTLQNPYDTLNEGVAAVPAAGHLMLKTGTFTGAGNVPITITKAMMIQSYLGTAVVR